MALILFYLSIFASSESLFIDDSAALSNLFANEILNATFHNGSHQFDAFKVLPSGSTTHVNGFVNSPNFTMINSKNSTEQNGSDPLMKRIVQDIDDLQVDTASPNVTGTEVKKYDMPSDQVSDEFSNESRVHDSDDLFMTRFFFDSFPEFSWHRNKRNDSSAEPKRNTKKRFTFFRRFILI